MIRCAKQLLALPLLLWLPMGATAAHGSADPTTDSAMHDARVALHHSHGGQLTSQLALQQFEVQSGNGTSLLHWQGEAWRGGDLNKLGARFEGDYDLEDNQFEELELQALYQRAISPFWNLTLGLRHDVRPAPNRTHLAIGLRGLAPYWLELDGAVFVSERGNLSARLEAEYDWRLSPQWILQPYVELNAATNDDRAIALGSGLTHSVAGLRLRYEINPALAPYFGITWSRYHGSSADLHRLAGDSRSQTSAVAGLKFWF